MVGDKGHALGSASSRLNGQSSRRLMCFTGRQGVLCGIPRISPDAFTVAIRPSTTTASSPHPVVTRSRVWVDELYQRVVYWLHDHCEQEHHLRLHRRQAISHSLCAPLWTCAMVECSTLKIAKRDVRSLVVLLTANYREKHSIDQYILRAHSYINAHTTA